MCHPFDPGPSLILRKILRNGQLCIKTHRDFIKTNLHAKRCSQDCATCPINLAVLQLARLCFFVKNAQVGTERRPETAMG